MILEPLIRGHVAWALGQIGGQSVEEALSKKLETETNSFVQSEIHAALSHAQPKT